VPVGEARPPLRNEFLGTPGWRSHEKGTWEEVLELLLPSGEAAGDGDGQKVDEAALETEEEEDDDEE
jgi:hypothetical protein